MIKDKKSSHIFNQIRHDPWEMWDFKIIYTI